MCSTHGGFLTSRGSGPPLFIDISTGDRRSDVNADVCRDKQSAEFWPNDTMDACSKRSERGRPYRTNGDVLFPLAHVGAFLQRCASALPEVPAAVGVPGLQAQPGKTSEEMIKVNKREDKLSASVFPV